MLPSPIIDGFALMIFEGCISSAQYQALCDFKMSGLDNRSVTSPLLAPTIGTHNNRPMQSRKADAILSVDVRFELQDLFQTLLRQSHVR